jgi:NDP-sugar pyrophosphorylase family protein
MLAQCNHTGAYFEANKTVRNHAQSFISNFKNIQVHRLLPKLHDNKPEIVPRVFTKESGVNCSDSWVSESAKVGTKCQIKRSIIGDNCELGQAAKVDNSVIMAGTQVQAGYAKDFIVSR